MNQTTWTFGVHTSLQCVVIGKPSALQSRQDKQIPHDPYALTRVDYALIPQESR
ncbi:MAG: hypothetical protein ACR2OA_19810 [Rubripirellula sp.]